MQEEGPCLCQTHEKTFAPEPGWGLFRGAGFQWRWRFCLTSICPTPVLVQQCWTSASGSAAHQWKDHWQYWSWDQLWLWPEHGGKGQLGVSNYLLPLQQAKCFFTLPPFLSFPSLVLSPHPLLTLLSSCYPCGPSFHLVLTVRGCVLSPLKWQKLIPVFVEFVFWNLMCQID